MKRLAILAAGLWLVAGLAGPARAHHPGHGAVVVRARPPVTVVVGPRVHPAPRLVAPGFVHVFPQGAHAGVTHWHGFAPFLAHPGKVVVVHPRTVVVPVAPVWIPGFWRWDGVGWVWVTGHWAWW